MADSFLWFIVFGQWTWTEQFHLGCHHSRAPLNLWRHIHVMPHNVCPNTLSPSSPRPATPQCPPQYPLFINVLMESKLLFFLFGVCACRSLLPWRCSSDKLMVLHTHTHTGWRSPSGQHSYRRSGVVGPLSTLGQNLGMWPIYG